MASSVVALMLAAVLVAGCGFLRGDQDANELSPAFGPASWRLDPAWAAPEADATELHVLVEEYACSNGSSAEGRVSEPRVEYGRSEVIITIGVREVTVPEGQGVNCQGNPELPMTVHLQQPLAGRTLVDPNARPEG